MEYGVEVLDGMISTNEMAARIHEQRHREVAEKRKLTLDEQLALVEPPGFRESRFNTNGNGRAACLPPWWPGALAEAALPPPSERAPSLSRRNAPLAQSRTMSSLPVIRKGDVALTEKL